MTCDAWPIVWPKPTNDYTAEVVAAAASFAQDTLWSLTGRRLGVCTATERYRAPGSGQCLRPYRDITDGQWRNGTESGGDCCAIRLEQTPVRSITSVKLFGVVVNPAQYYLSRNRVVRNGACWPSIDDCTEPVIEVVYRHGEPVDKAELAMGELAFEYLLGLSGDLTCRLPSTATSISRQGVTVQLSDPTTLFKDGRTGLPLSDAFIRAANPNRLPQRSRVYSPDFARRA